MHPSVNSPGAADLTSTATSLPSTYAYGNLADTHPLLSRSPHKHQNPKKSLRNLTMNLVFLTFAFLIFLLVAVLLVILLVWQQMRDADMQKYNMRKFAIVGDWGRHGLFYQNDVAQRMAEFCDGNGDEYDELDQIEEPGMAAATLHSVRKHGKQMVSLKSPPRDRRSSCHEIISVGDNLYEDGVTTPDSNEFDLSYSLIYLKYPSLNIDWRIMFGNHDYKKNPHAQIEYARRPETRWIADGLYYAYDVATPKKDAQFRFIVIDTVPLVSQYWDPSASINHTALYDPSEQLKWFEEELAEAQEANKPAIVFGHHPVYCVSDKDPSETDDMQKAVEHLLIKYKVLAYVAGHEHVLEHIEMTKSLNDTVRGRSADAAAVEPHTVHHIVTGAGSRTRPIPTEHPIKPHMKFGYSEGGFVALTLKPEAVFMQFISHTGDDLHNFEIKL